MLGVPLPTRLYGYQLRVGRWLAPEDGYAMVLNHRLAEDVGVGVGDWVTIHYSKKQRARLAGRRAGLRSAADQLGERAARAAAARCGQRGARPDGVGQDPTCKRR